MGKDLSASNNEQVKGITPETRIRHDDKLKPARPKVDVAKLTFDKLELLSNSPKNLTIAMEPKEGDYLVFHPTPGFDFYAGPLAQLSVVACVNNSGNSQVDLNKVTIEYKKGNQNITKDILLPADQLKVDPGYTWCWQNSRDYHEMGDVIYLEAPYPTEATFKFYFKNFTDPLIVNKKLKPYDTAMELPFQKKRFAPR
ncbi:MAG TPA: hypothetical protein VM935_14930 [Chitinophagaceae bacterium]|jgi:hypothetical protein|nr:hypothetical protein [Chitinophagaceae bacterium]